jgi:hypothetical protein
MPHTQRVAGGEQTAAAPRKLARRSIPKTGYSPRMALVRKVTPRAYVVTWMAALVASLIAQ